MIFRLLIKEGAEVWALAEAHNRSNYWVSIRETNSFVIVLLPHFADKNGLLRRSHRDGRPRQAMRGSNPLPGGASAAGARVGGLLRRPTPAATGRHLSRGGESVLQSRPAIRMKNSGTTFGFVSSRARFKSFSFWKNDRVRRSRSIGEGAETQYIRPMQASCLLH